MEVLAFSVLTYISMMGRQTGGSLKIKRSAFHLLKTGQEGQYNLLQFSVWCLWDLAVSPERERNKVNSITTSVNSKSVTCDYEICLTWLLRANPGAGWGRAVGKPSRTLWSCWAPSCPSVPWHQRRWLSPAPRWPWELKDRWKAGFRGLI